MKRSKPSDIWAVFVVLSSVVGAFVLKSILAFDVNTWVVGIGIFVLLAAVWGIAYSYLERRRFGRYLNGLPPGQRLAAMDEYYGGAISRAMQTPEFKKKAKEEQERLEGRLGPILKRLERNTAGPLSFSAKNQIEEDIKELQSELRPKDTSEPNPALQRTRRNSAPRR